MLVAPYTTETAVGHAGSQRAAAFCVLAFRLWEWTGAAAVFVFLCAAVFLTPPLAVLEGKVREG